MYKKASLMSGANLASPNRHYPKKGKLHGPVRIAMIDGRPVEPPVELPGDYSSQAACDHCQDYFPLRPETVVVLLDETYQRTEFEPVRKYRWFCCGEHADGWIAGAEYRRMFQAQLQGKPLKRLQGRILERSTMTPEELLAAIQTRVEQNEAGLEIWLSHTAWAGAKCDGESFAGFLGDILGLSQAQKGEQIDDGNHGIPESDAADRRDP